MQPFFFMFLKGANNSRADYILYIHYSDLSRATYTEVQNRTRDKRVKDRRGKVQFQIPRVIAQTILEYLKNTILQLHTSFHT